MDWQLPLERLAAVDGRSLSWETLLREGTLTKEAGEEAAFAEEKQLPTICSHTGSFSPHLTLPAVGCALSHRKAWERIAKQASGLSLA